MAKRTRQLALLIGTVIFAWLLARIFLIDDITRSGENSTTRLGPFRAGGTLAEAFASLSEAPASAVSISLLADNNRAWTTRWKMLDAAQHSIDVQYFILKNDIFGLSFLGHLLKKAREGVAVRLFLDAMGLKMSHVGHARLNALAGTKGIDIRLYRPLNRRYFQALILLNPSAVLASNHDKILLCDTQRGIVGGRNISREYFSAVELLDTAFRDVDVALEGNGITAQLRDYFADSFYNGDTQKIGENTQGLRHFERELLAAYGAMDAWLRGKPLAPSGERWRRELEMNASLFGALPPRFEAGATTTPVVLINSHVRIKSGEDPISVTMARLVRSARHSIFLHSPYFVLNKQALGVLEEASRRGVRISIVTNSAISSDDTASQAFFLEQWPELLARVPTLRLFVGGDAHNLHGKFAVFDDVVVAVGTYNLDPVSMGLNSELIAVMQSESLAREILERPRRLLAQGPPAVYELKIRRDDFGQPLRNARGEVIPEPMPFPARPDGRTRLRVYHALVRSLRWLPGYPFLF